MLLSRVHVFSQSVNSYRFQYSLLIFILIFSVAFTYLKPFLSVHTHTHRQACTHTYTDERAVSHIRSKGFRPHSAASFHWKSGICEWNVPFSCLDRSSPWSRIQSRTPHWISDIPAGERSDLVWPTTPSSAAIVPFVYLPSSLSMRYPGFRAICQDFCLAWAVAVYVQPLRDLAIEF